MKIAIYAIALNESDFAVRFIEACAEADCVIVADTGSTDGTTDLLRQHGAIVHDVRIRPWRFDDARNAALALVPDNIDICIALDLDEVLAPGWRDRLERAWTADTTRASFSLIYSHQPDGSPGITFLNNRIHARRGYRWRHACHEALYPDRIIEQVIALPDMQVDHWPDMAKSRSSYLELLKAAVAEEPYSPRMAHYLAREYYFVGQHQDAIAEYERYLSFTDKPFIAERVGAFMTMAACARALGRDPTPYFFRALAEAPDAREPWLGLAEHYYRQAAWPACHGAALRGLSITASQTGYPTDPYYWGSLGDDLAAIASWNLGLRAAALGHAEKAAKLAPWDERLHANLRFMKAELADGSAILP
jgi:glycosyltransferase involved in cell wall biosynthesis